MRMGIFTVTPTLLKIYKEQDLILRNKLEIAFAINAVEYSTYTTRFELMVAVLSTP